MPKLRRVLTHLTFLWVQYLSALPFRKWEKRMAVRRCFFSSEAEMKATNIFSLSVVLTFYHARPTWAECCAAISSWIAHSPHSVSVLDSRTILIRLRDEKDMAKVLACDSFLLGSFPFSLCRWIDYNRERDKSMAPVWITFPNLPIKCIPVLHGIAGCLGRPLGMDTATSHLLRLFAARICVEVDLS